MEFDELNTRLAAGDHAFRRAIAHVGLLEAEQVERRRVAHERGVAVELESEQVVPELERLIEIGDREAHHRAENIPRRRVGLRRRLDRLDEIAVRVAEQDRLDGAERTHRDAHGCA